LFYYIYYNNNSSGNYYNQLLFFDIVIKKYLYINISIYKYIKYLLLFFFVNSWKFGGKNVFLTGTFDNWQGKYRYI